MKLLLSLSLILMGIVAFSQNSDYTEMMKNERQELKSLGQSYVLLEQHWIGNSIQFPALVSLIHTNEQKQFQFQAYKETRPERVESIKERLQTICPNLVFIDIQDHSFVAFFNNSCLESEIIEFFRIVGYTGFELTE